MTPKSLMILGTICISVAAICAAIAAEYAPSSAYPLVIIGVAGGALFGKGYGIWEERQKGRRE